MTTTSISIEIHNSWSILFWNLTANGVYDFRQGAGHIKIFSKYFEKKKKNFFWSVLIRKPTKAVTKKSKFTGNLDANYYKKCEQSPLLQLLVLIHFHSKVICWSLNFPIKLSCEVLYHVHSKWRAPHYPSYKLISS